MCQQCRGSPSIRASVGVCALNLLFQQLSDREEERERDREMSDGAQKRWRLGSVFTLALRPPTVQRNINISKGSGAGAEGWRGGRQKLWFVCLFAQTEERRTNLPLSVQSNFIYTAFVTVGISFFYRNPEPHCSDPQWHEGKKTFNWEKPRAGPWSAAEKEETDQAEMNRNTLAMEVLSFSWVSFQSVNSRPTKVHTMFGYTEKDPVVCVTAGVCRALPFAHINIWCSLIKVSWSVNTEQTDHGGTLGFEPLLCD